MADLKQTHLYAYPDFSYCGTTNGQILQDHIFFSEAGWFLSDVYDSGHTGMKWDRLACYIAADHIQLSIWIVEQRQLVASTPEIPPTIVSKHPHVLLYHAPGRYLRFLLQMPVNATLYGFEMSFPYRTHMELLPQFYQDHHELHLFHAPLEDAFLTLQQEITDINQMWNPHKASEKQLQELLCLYGRTEFLHQKEAILRELMEQRFEWLTNRGSCKSLTCMCKILLQRNVMVVEEGSCLHVILPYEQEDDPIILAKIIEGECYLGAQVQIHWLLSASLDSSYLDMEQCMDQMNQSYLDQSSVGTCLWQ